VKAVGCPGWVDTVEKVVWGKQTKFSRAADTFRARRREGPRRFSEKRPRTFVSALLSVAAAAWSKNQHLRDFWLRSIFDFFDSIGQTEKNSLRANVSTLRFHFASNSAAHEHESCVKSRLIVPKQEVQSQRSVAIC
jgi:hypothetical protein